MHCEKFGVGVAWVALGDVPSEQKVEDISMLKDAGQGRSCNGHYRAR